MKIIKPGKQDYKSPTQNQQTFKFTCSNKSCEAIFECNSSEIYREIVNKTETAGTFAIFTLCPCCGVKTPLLENMLPRYFNPFSIDDKSTVLKFLKEKAIQELLDLQTNEEDKEKILNEFPLED